MTKPSHWDVARAANTMAIRTTVTLDPNLITPRIKNKLIKWLESGFLDGGYRSEARKIGDMLVDKYELPVSRKSWRGLQISNPSRELAAELKELMNADWLAFIMEHPNVNKPEHWYHKDYHASIHWLDKERYGSRYLTIHDEKSYRAQILHTVERHTGKEGAERIARAIEAIKGTEPIHLYTH